MIAPEPEDPELAPLGAWLHQAEGFIRRFVVLGDDEATAIALWVAHTHAFEAAVATPYLSISSAEMESGKTRLLEVLRLLVATPWFTGRTSTAALTRKIDKAGPTLLLDESDPAFKGDKEYAETLRGVLNTAIARVAPSLSASASSTSTRGTSPPSARRRSRGSAACRTPF